MSDRPVVRCMRCHMNQFAQLQCRRCKAVLPKVRLPIAKPSLGNVLASVAILPTMDQLREQLIEEAMRRCGGSRALAARMIGIAKSTAYREFPKWNQGENDSTCTADGAMAQSA